MHRTTPVQPPLTSVPAALTLALALTLVCTSAGCRESIASAAPEDADASASRRARKTHADLYIGTIARLSPIHAPLLHSHSGDWTSQHQEPQQSFADYIAAQGQPAILQPKLVVLQPIGALTEVQSRIVALTAQFLEAFYDVRVRVAAPLGVRKAPTWAKRRNDLGDSQLHTRWLLREVLPDRLPSDAAAVIGLTAQDLWPGTGWAYVFGQATFTRRVGVWSLYRLGDPTESTLHFQAVLVRTLKVAAHELGHVLGVRHCTTHKCLMNGSASREELDRHPLGLCAEDVAKVTWATGANPLARFERLEAFADDNGLLPEARAYRWAVRMLRGAESDELPL